IGHVVELQMMLRDKMAGSLAYDIGGDGTFTSLTKLKMLQNAVPAKCDAKDGIKDGVVDDPLACKFNPEVDPATHLCPGDRDTDECLTRRQLQTIQGIYSGQHDSRGNPIKKANLVCRGMAVGSEYTWATDLIPHGADKRVWPLLGVAADHVNYLFYEND